MTDTLMPFIDWIGPLLRQPFPEEFVPGSEEHDILSALRDGWARVETAPLLTGLTSRFGERAREVVGRFVEACVRRDWAEIGEREAHPGSEIDDFVRVLWGPLPEMGFEFTMEGDQNDRQFRVTRCPAYEAAAAAGLEEWMYSLACATDLVSTPAFSPKIQFDRTESLMEGRSQCNHRYRLRPAN
jgi:predicted ArsR family transcriptional regulator